MCRKNWLFAGGNNGGRTGAMLFTITATCRRLKLDAFAYLRNVLRRLPELPAANLDTLLPDRWAAMQRDTS